MKLFLKCNEATHLCDKNQYKENGFWDVMVLKLHLILCTVCRSNARKNVKLTKTLATANIKTLCKEDKKRLKEKLKTEFVSDRNPK